MSRKVRIVSRIDDPQVEAQIQEIIRVVNDTGEEIVDHEYHSNPHRTVPEDIFRVLPETPEFETCEFIWDVTLRWHKARRAAYYELRTDLNWGSAEGRIYLGNALTYSFTPTKRKYTFYLKSVNAVDQYSEEYVTVTLEKETPSTPNPPTLKSFFGAILIIVNPLVEHGVKGYYAYVTKGETTEKIPFENLRHVYQLESGDTISVQVSAYDILGEGGKSGVAQATTTALQDRDIPENIVTPSKLTEDLRSGIDLSNTRIAEYWNQVIGYPTEEDQTVVGTTVTLNYSAGDIYVGTEIETDPNSFYNLTTQTDDECLDAEGNEVKVVDVLDENGVTLLGVGKPEWYGAGTTEQVKLVLSAIPVDPNVRIHYAVKKLLRNLSKDALLKKGVTAKQIDANIIDAIENLKGKAWNEVLAEEERLAKVAERLGTAESDLAEVEGTVSTHETRITSAEGEIDGAKQRLLDAEGRLSSVDSEIDGAKTRLTDAENDISGISTRVGNAETDLADARNRLSTAEGGLEGLEGVVSTHETKISNVEGELSTKVSETEFNALEGTVSTQGTTLTQHAGQIAAKAEQSEVDTLSDAVSSNTATLGVHATQIAARVTKEVYNLLEDRVEEAEGELAVLADEISAKVSQTIFEDLQSRVTDNEAELLVQADAIQARVTQEVYNTLANRVTTAEGTLEVLPEQIALKASQSEVDTLTDKVEDNEAELVVLATEISSKVSQTVFDTLSGTVASQGTQITQNATAIESKADQSVVDTLSGTVSDQSTLISQNATAITQKADKSTVDTLTGRVSAAEATLSTHADEIEARATKEEVDTLEGRVTEAEGQLTIQAGKIEAKAEKSEVQALEGDLSTVSNQVGTLTTSYNSISARVEAVEGVTDDLTGEVSDVKTRTGNLEVRAGKIEASVSAIEEDVDDHGNRLLTVENAVVNVLPGQIALKANASEVYKKGEIDTKLGQKADSATVSELTTRITDAELTIDAHAGAIAQKAERTEVYTKTETDSKLGTKVDTTTYTNKVGELETSIEGITGRVSNTETNIDNLTGEISSVKSDVSQLEIRADGIQSTVGTLQHQAAIFKPEDGKLWHFDNSLNSTDGIKPLEGAVATLRPNEGRFGGAVAVEEGTENLLSGRWSKGNAIEIEPEEGFSIAAKFVIDVDDARVYKLTNADVNIPCQPNTFYTLSYYARVVRGKAALTTGTQIYIGSDTQGTVGVVNQQIYNDMDYEWKRFVVTGSTDADATRITRATFRLQSTREEIVEIEIADWQLEQKPFATSFVDGARPDGILAYPISLADDHTIACYRKSHTDEDYRHIVKRSDGKVYVDGVEDSEYDVGWLGYDGDTLMLSNQTGLVDELLVLDYEATEEEIKGWYDAKKPFVDQDEINYQASQIKQTADSIDLLATRVTDIDGKTTIEKFAELELTPEEISSVVVDYTNPAGTLWTAVDQKADSVALQAVSERVDDTESFVDKFAVLELTPEQISSTVASVEDPETGLSTVSSQVTHLVDQWTVKLDANGHVAGIGLAMDDDNISEFAVVADKFSIATPYGGVTRTKTILEDTYLYINDSTPYGHWDLLTLGGDHTHILLKTPEIPENATSLKLHLYGDLYDSNDDFILHFQCIAQDWNEDTANYNDFHNQYVGVKLDFPIAGDLEEGWRWYEFDVTPLLEVIKNNETYGIALTTTGLYEGVFYSKDYTNTEFHPYVEYIQPNVNVFTVTDGKVYLIGDMIAEGSILAEQLEADVMKTLLLQAELAIIDDADILKLDAQRIFVGDNIELGDNKVVVKGYPSTRLDITEDTYVEDSAGNNSNSDTVIFVPQVNVDLYTKVPLPKASHVVKAELHFYASSWGGTSGPPPTIKDFNVSACSSNWDYQTITGANRPTATSWTKRFQLSMTTSGWISLDITDLVNKWLSKELPNYGVRFHKSIETDFIMYAHSSRYADVSLRPHITFEYSEDNLATKAALGDLGGLPWLDGVIPQGTPPSLYAIDAYLTGRFSVANGDKLLAELYKDSLGGRLLLNDNDGKPMIAIGASDWEHYTSGSIKIYNPMIENPTAEDFIFNVGHRNDETILSVLGNTREYASVFNVGNNRSILGFGMDFDEDGSMGAGIFMSIFDDKVNFYIQHPSLGMLGAGNCSGEYIGDGTSSRDIPLPFRTTANLVIVWNSAFTKVFFIGRSMARELVQGTTSTSSYTNATGFHVSGTSWANALNEAYYYLAFN